ncbi:MAG: 50S ribosomal protein L28 [Ardenticatenales bacterium]|nr:50S ribosomal protein L28 [Ardenticatenales bacterium]
MAKCERCGKKPVAGKNVSHSQVRTRRMFSPNIQKFLIMVNGERTRMKLCTRCARTLVKTA